MNIPLGAYFQWGDNPDNVFLVLEQDVKNSKYILLVGTSSMTYPNGNDFRADLGDVITLSSAIVENFARPLPEITPSLQEAMDILRARLLEEKIASMLRFNYGREGVA